MICVRWYLITLSAITIAGVVTVPVAASARNNLKIRISLRRVSILRGEDHSSIRLNKYISESGICSRRDADRYIEQGNVFINGKRATVGAQVFAGDVVKVNGQLIEPRNEEDLC